MQNGCSRPHKAPAFGPVQMMRIGNFLRDPSQQLLRRLFHSHGRVAPVWRQSKVQYRQGRLSLQQDFRIQRVTIFCSALKTTNVSEDLSSRTSRHAASSIVALASDINCTKRDGLADVALPVLSGRSQSLYFCHGLMMTGAASGDGYESSFSPRFCDALQRWIWIWLFATCTLPPPFPWCSRKIV